MLETHKSRVSETHKLMCGHNKDLSQASAQRMKYLSTRPVKLVVVVVAMKCDIYTSHNEIMDAAREECHTTTTTTTTTSTTTTDHKLTIQ